MWSTLYPDEDFNVKDDVYGTVIGSCSKGIFLRMDNGQEAFAYFNILGIGTRVRCSVRRKANESRRMLVSVDSLINDPIMAA